MPSNLYHNPDGFCACEDASMRRIATNSDAYWEVCYHCGLPIEHSYVRVTDESVKIWHPHLREENRP